MDGAEQPKHIAVFVAGADLLPAIVDHKAVVEEIVNEKIAENIDVVTNVMTIEEAKKMGAMALFGEKYGDTVRVVNVSGRSIEFCGGTHVTNTSKIGLFKIISESSVAAGVRRIEAVTGTGVLDYIEQMNGTLGETASNLKVNGVGEVAQKSAAVMAELKAKDKVEEAIQNSNNHVLILEEYMPWQDFVLSSESDKAKDLWYAIYPSKRGGYALYCVVKK